MRARIFVVALLAAALAACGGSHPPNQTANQTGSGNSTSGHATGDGNGGSSTTGDSSGGDNAGNTGGGTTAGEGQVCAFGGRSPMHGREAPACPAGLSCCYPCGIDGCDSVCMKDCGPPRP